MKIVTINSTIIRFLDQKLINTEKINASSSK